MNVAITNVPGPRQPVHLAGRELESSHPAMSISDRAPLHIGVQSGPEVVGIGAVACRDNLDDLGSLLAGAAARAGRARRHRHRPVNVDCRFSWNAVMPSA